MKYVSLWISTAHIYLLKYEKNILGRLTSCQGSAYRRVDTQEAMRETIRDVWQTYGLQGYTPRLVVGGTPLVWQKLDIVAENRQQARELLVWEGTFTEYAFDVQAAATGTQKSWYVAAYPKAQLDDIIEAIQEQGRLLQDIDVLPAVISRWHQHDTDQVVITEGSLCHQVTLQQGIPEHYRVTSGSGEGPADRGIAAPRTAALMERWQLSLPEGVLSAF